MLSRKKRDAKFLIFQSLYIIAISILFYKGTDLSLVAVKDATDSTNAFLSSTETKIDTSLLNELSKNNTYINTDKDSVIDKNTLLQITRKASENNKEPIVIQKQNVQIPPPPVPVEKETEKKPDKKPTPLPNQDVTEFSNQPFTNPSAEKKLLVYQNGSLIGIIEPGRTKSLKVKSGGKISYGYSD
ncbi:MAG TPA: hypothetical protein PKC91_04335 [Ignavibacteria bacterium]|nr:hypothetical protein [Ignavibacteria bacterium]